MKSKPPLLYLTSLAPFPGNTGGEVSIRERLNFLSEHFEIHCLIHNSQKFDLERKNQFISLWKSRLKTIQFFDPPWKDLSIFRRFLYFMKALVSSKPWMHFTTSTAMVQEIKNLKKSLPESVPTMVEGWVGLSLPHLGWTVGKNDFYFAHNNEYLYHLAIANSSKIGVLKLRNGIEAFKLKNYEGEAIQQYNGKVMVSSKKDQRSVKDMYDIQSILLPFIYPFKGGWDEGLAQKNRYVFIFTNASHEPNRDGILWFISKVWRNFPNNGFSLFISGKDNQNFLKSLEKLDGRIKYLGCLDPKDLEARICGATLCLNPTRYGSGTPIKVLEALSLGCPMVSTHICCPEEFLDMIPTADAAEEFLKTLLDSLSQAHLLSQKQSSFFHVYQKEAKEKLVELLMK